MNDDQCAFLRTILIKSYHHNVRIKGMETAARGLVQLGGHDKRIDLDCLRFDLVEDVLDFLGVPAEEAQRRRFRFWLERAGMKESGLIGFDGLSLDLSLHQFPAFRLRGWNVQHTPSSPNRCYPFRKNPADP